MKFEIMSLLLNFFPTVASTQQSVSSSTKMTSQQEVSAYSSSQQSASAYSSMSSSAKSKQMSAR